METIMFKLNELLNYENLLFPGKKTEYYINEWEKIKNLIKDIDENNVYESAKKIDDCIDAILEYVSGNVPGYTLSSFFGFYKNGIANDVLLLLPENKNNRALTSSSRSSSSSITSVLSLLNTPEKFEKYDITIKSDFVKSLANYFKIQCNSFDDFLDHTNYNVTIINATNENHVNYNLQSIADINDGTMIDSIAHISRKQKKQHEIQFPTLTSSNEYHQLKSLQKTNYNRFFGLSHEKNADPLKNYNVKMTPLTNLPPLPEIINTFSSNKNTKFIKNNITLFVSKYTIYLSRNFHKIENSTKINWKELFTT